jgi:hypothetical protein
MSTWKPIVLWLPLFTAAVAAEPTHTPGLTVEATYVEELRSTEKRFAWRSRCEVGLAFSGAPIAGAISITEMLIDAASDDTGKCLIRNRVSTDSRLRDPNPKPPCGHLTCRLDLLGTNREAKKIRQIGGEVTVFVPQPDDTVTLRDIRANPGKAFSGVLLSKHKVRVVYLDKDLLAKPKKELAALLEYQFDEKELGTLSELESLPQTGNRYVHFLMRDPDKRIMQWYFVDAAGTILPGDLRSIGSVRIYRPAKGVQDPLHLRVCFLTEAGLKRVRFDIRDIALP